MNQKTSDYRKELADMFINVLEEKELDWKKDWKGSMQAPMNAKSQAMYKGINRFRLMLVSMTEGYEDPRWATFNQIKEMGYHLEDAKGKGVKVEYWFPYDQKEKKSISWEEFHNRVEGEKDERYVLRAKYSTVFNAALIKGIPELPEPETFDVSPDELIHTLSSNMGVEIVNDGGDRAFYRPSEDKIHLPLPEVFFSDYGYNSTVLHELAHSTGASKRLNRDLGHSFGSPEYAYEELIAEITSCFMSANLNMEQDEIHLKNHKAYVQSWIKAISEKPETLVKAIAEAEKATAYMEYHAELIPKAEYEKVVRSSMEVKKDIVAMDLEDYLRKKGVGSPFGPYQDDKLIGHAKVLRQNSTKKDYENTSKEYWEDREAAKAEYGQMLEKGKVRPLTEIERTIRTANGHPDNPSVQAARRMAEKRGYDWRTGDMLEKNEKKQRLLIDMDGTLAKFKQVDTLETLYEKGYFFNLEPIPNVLDAVKHIIKNHPELDVYIMSAVLSDSKYAWEEKNDWLDQYLPEIDMDHRLFPPCGANKLNYVPSGIRENDYLLDDYTQNLTLWEPPAKGIKLLNGINHTNQSWQGNMLRYDKAPEQLAEDMIQIMEHGKLIRDIRPQDEPIQERTPEEPEIQKKKTVMKKVSGPKL